MGVITEKTLQRPIGASFTSQNVHRIDVHYVARWRVRSGATSDSDQIGQTGTLTFAPGATTKTITIEVKGDDKKEANEMFYLDQFGLSSNALFTKNRGLGTILNDD